MSAREALRAGVRKLRGGDRLEEQVAALAAAEEASRGRLSEPVTSHAASVVHRSQTRLRFSGAHTVVALAGATGSGKSSTFNALTGLDLAAVGVRRPTTSHPTACVWGEDPADELLDWLEVPPRHRATQGSTLGSTSGSTPGQAPGPGREATDLDGLVLIDLPDHDSTEVAHHLEVERLVGMVDLVVWLLDPQKYADAAVHRRFLAPMASHREVFLVVLNRIDEVAADQRGVLVDDIRRLLAADGLDDVPVLTTSARTGEGLDDLRSAVQERVSSKAAGRARLAADVRAAADRLAAESGSAEPRALRDRDRTALHRVMADAAGVPVVVGAVHRATTVRGRRATGWPVTAWLGRLRPDPLRRLRVGGAAATPDAVIAARSSLSGPSHVERARVESAVRDLGDTVGRDLAPPWARAVRAASVSRLEDLEDRLDEAVVRTDLGTVGLPWWCRPVQAAQWGLLAAAAVGALWLGALAVLGYLQVPDPGTPEWGGVPLPTWLLLGGVVLGLLLSLLARGLLRFSARSRARAAETRLRGAVSRVADDLVVAPVTAELDAHRATYDALRLARR